ncbi:MAG: hypothetical protein ACRDLR_03830 [Gaiellaceae bacterium]
MLENVLGLLGIALFIVCVTSFAAGITWIVVKVSPAPGSKKKRAAES